MAEKRDKQGRERPPKPDAVPDQQIEGKQGRRDGAAKVDRENDLRGIQRMREPIGRGEKPRLPRGDKSVVT